MPPYIIISNKPSTSTEVNGVKFHKDRDQMVSEEVDQATADYFARCPGYKVIDKDQPKDDTDKTGGGDKDKSKADGQQSGGGANKAGANKTGGKSGAKSGPKSGGKTTGQVKGAAGEGQQTGTADAPAAGDAEQSVGAPHGGEADSASTQADAAGDGQQSGGGEGGDGK